MRTINKRLSIFLTAIPVLLSVPLIAMQFTDEVNWSVGDFIVMGLLLLVFSLLLEFGLRWLGQSRHPSLIYAVVFLLFLAAWAELGVGVFGTPFAGN